MGLWAIAMGLWPLRWAWPLAGPGHSPGLATRPARLPLVPCRRGASVDRSDRVRMREDGLDRNPAGSGQREPDRLLLVPSRGEPVSAPRVLEVQRHADGRVLPDQPARLDQHRLARPKVPDEGVARAVEQQQARAALRGEPVNEPADRIMPLGVVALLGGEPYPCL